MSYVRMHCAPVRLSVVVTADALALSRWSCAMEERQDTCCTNLLGTYLRRALRSLLDVEHSVVTRCGTPLSSQRNHLAYETHPELQPRRLCSEFTTRPMTVGAGSVGAAEPEHFVWHLP